MAGLGPVVTIHVFLVVLSPSTAAVPDVSTTPSSTTPQTHPPTLPGELCSLYTPSRLGVYMYTTVICVVVYSCVCYLFILPSLPHPLPSTAIIASSTSLPCTSSSAVSPVSVSTTPAGESWSMYTHLNSANLECIS